MTGRISEIHAKRLKERGLDIDLCEALGFRTLDGALAHDYVVNGRVFNSKKRMGKGQMPWATGLEGKPAPLWNIDSLRGPIEQGEVLVITEGELDGASVVQAEFTRVVSVPTGAPPKPEGPESDRYACFRRPGSEDLLPDIDKFERIVLAVDGDEKGQHLRNDLAALLGDHRCYWVKWPEGCKDANDILQKGRGEKDLVNAITNAKVMWNDEIGYAEDFEDRKVETFKVWNAEHESAGARLDLRVELPGFMVLLGPYHHGKSTLLRQLLWNMWVNNGWKFLLTCLEEPVRPRTYNKFLTLALGQRPGTLGLKNIERGWSEQARLEAAKAEVNKAALFMVRPKSALLTPEHFFDRIKTAARREKVKVIALDPVNELDHHIDNRNETHYWGNFILDCKAIADEFGLLFIVAGHPSKQGVDRLGFKKLLRALDMSGTANWGNKADISMCMWKPGHDGKALLHMEKIKDHETMGHAPVLYELTHDNRKDTFTVTDQGWHLWQEEKKGK